MTKDPKVLLRESRALSESLIKDQQQEAPTSNQQLLQRVLVALNLAMSGFRAHKDRYGDGETTVAGNRAQAVIEELLPDVEAAASSPVETSTCIDCIELKNALAAAVKVANEARECHDRDQDMRTMKLLLALSGNIPKWRADTDRIHDVLRRAVERLDKPVQQVEPTDQPRKNLTELPPAGPPSEIIEVKP